MTFEQIIQKVGKEIELSVLYEENGVASVIGYDNIKRAKITFNCGLTGSVMNGIELELYTALPDVPITLSVTAKFGEDTATKLYQNYHFKEAPTYNADSKTYTHILYDEMINLMVEYQPITINYPTTLIQFFQRLVTELNLTTDISSLPNGNRTIAQDPYTGINYTYRDALDDIGQATGTLFKVDNTQLIKCNLGTTAKVIDDDILKNQNISMGKHFGPINVIVLSRAGGSDNIYYPETLPENPIEYKISDNILMNDNNRADYLQELYNALYGIEYDIYDCQLVGYGGFEPLDKVSIQTYEDATLKTYNSYVFNNEIVMNGGGYEESIYTELPEETNTEYQYADTTDRRLNQTYLIVDKQNQTITSVVNEVDGQNSKISQITQDVNEIKQEISNISGMTMTQETESTGRVAFTDVSPESSPTLIKIHPTSQNISYMYPRSNLYPSSNLYSTPRKLIFHNDEENEDIEYILPDDLLYYDSTHYDEFYYDAGTETCQITKRCKYNADGSVGLLSQEQVNAYDYSENEIELTEGTYSSVYLPYYSSGYLYVTLMAKNMYTDQFYTKVETRSVIDQKIDEIDLGVYQEFTDLQGQVTTNSSQITINTNGINQRVEKNKVISEINQTEEQITINANRVNISGVITAINNDTTTTIDGNKITTGTITASQVASDIITTTNFSAQNINADNITAGTLSAASINLGSGKFAVTTAGSVNATDGKVGGFTLSNSSLTATSTRGIGIYTSGRISFANDYGWVNSGSAGTWIQGNSYSYPCYVLDRFSRPDMDGVTSIRIHSHSGKTYISNDTSFGSSSGTGGSSLGNSDIELAANNGSTRIYNKINNWIRAGYYNILEGSSGVILTGSGINVGRGSSTFGFSAAGSVEIGGSNTSVYIKGSPYGGSSRNMKKDIKPLTSNELNKIYDAYKEQNVYSFRYKKDFNDDTKKKRYGFILDEMENTILKDTLDIETIDNKETKNYNPEYLSRTNFIVIKMLQDKIDALQEEIEELKK